MPSKVVVVSAFRDSAGRIPGFIAQAEALTWPAQDLAFVAVEGDSQDGTRAALYAWAQRDSRVTVLRCDTGRPHYGSVIDAERFKTLAAVFNTGLDYVADDPDAEYFQFLPSDVRFPPDLIGRLIGWGKDVIAPLFWCPGGQQFYDIWGFTRLDGWDFPPYRTGRNTTICSATRRFACKPWAAPSSCAAPFGRPAPATRRRKSTAVFAARPAGSTSAFGATPQLTSSTGAPDAAQRLSLSWLHRARVSFFSQEARGLCVRPGCGVNHDGHGKTSATRGAICGESGGAGESG